MGIIASLCESREAHSSPEDPESTGMVQLAKPRGIESSIYASMSRNSRNKF